MSKEASRPDENDFRHRYPSHWRPLHTHHAGFKDPTHVAFYDPKSGLDLQWHSRAHRKGILPRPAKSQAPSNLALERHFPRLVGVDIKDISWAVAFLFLFGSVFWCINGVMSFDFFVVSTNAIANAEAATAFLGGTLFLIGGYLGRVSIIRLPSSRSIDLKCRLCGKSEPK